MSKYYKSRDLGLTNYQVDINGRYVLHIGWNIFEIGLLYILGRDMNIKQWLESESITTYFTSHHPHPSQWPDRDMMGKFATIYNRIWYFLAGGIIIISIISYVINLLMGQHTSPW
jgi:hypothetical protein